MAELFRDTPFGHLVRFLTNKRYFKFAEEEDPSIWTRYIDEKKSGNLAHHGDINAPDDGTELEGLGGVRTRDDQFTLEPPAIRPSGYRSSDSSSSRTRVGDENENVNHASGITVDPEKGKDVHLVSWYGPDDPGEWPSS